MNGNSGKEKTHPALIALVPRALKAPLSRGEFNVSLVAGSVTAGLSTE